MSEYAASCLVMMHPSTRRVRPLLVKGHSVSLSSLSHMSTTPEGTRDSPSVGFLVTVVQRLKALLFLLLAEASGVRHFEEGWSKLHQPARVDGGHLTHVLLGGQHQLMVHNPVDIKGE